MKNTKLIKGPTQVRKIRAVRFYAGIYFTVLMTLLAPIYPAQSPVFRLNQAEAEDVDFKSYARAAMKIQYNWDGDEFKCLGKLWGKESAWNHEAKSPTHDYGIPQRHMSGNSQQEIEKFLNNPLFQVHWGLNYINHRYGSPCEALKFHEVRNWY